LAANPAGEPLLSPKVAAIEMYGMMNLEGRNA